MTPIMWWSPGTSAMALIPLCLLSVMALGLHSCYLHWVTRTVATSIRGCYPQWPSGLCGCYLCLDCYLYWDAYTVATPVRSCYPQWPSGLCGCYPRCGCYLCRFSAARPSSFLFALSLRSSGYWEAGYVDISPDLQ